MISKIQVVTIGDDGCKDAFADLALLESDQSKLDAVERSELHSIDLTARSQSDLHLVPKQSRLIMKGYPFERKQCDYDNQKITHLRPVGLLPLRLRESILVV